MAEKSYHKTAEERIKTIVEHLKDLESAAGFIHSLINHERSCGEKTVNLGIDTLGFFACTMDVAVDTVSAELGVFRYEGRPEAFAFIRKPQAAALSPDSQEDPQKTKSPGWPELPEKVEEDLKQLDHLGDCLRTLAEIREKMEENTLLVTTDQLRSWGLVCNHVAMWVPENLCGEEEAAPEGGAA